MLRRVIYTVSAGPADTVTDANNRLLSDGTHAYAYDAEGNRVRKTVTATGESTDYTWDHRNRLKGITFKDGTGSLTGRLSYRYDPADRRIMRLHDTDGDGTYETRESFVFDQGVKNGLDDCLLVFENNTLTQRLLHGPAVDQPLAQEDAAGAVLWLLADPLGTVRDLAQRTAAGGTLIVNHASYDSFGRLLSQSDPNIPSRYGFTGREWDADAGLWWYRARWYDPAVGRFVSEEPLLLAGVGANTSVYVGNNAAIVVDPSGLVGVLEALAAEGAVEAAGGAALAGPAAAVVGVGAVLTAGAYYVSDAGSRWYYGPDPSENLPPLPRPKPKLPLPRWITDPKPDTVPWPDDKCFRPKPEPSGRGAGDGNKKRCRPCVPPVETIAFELHVPPSKPHAGLTHHYHWFQMHQSPPDACRCFWKRNIVDPTDMAKGMIYPNAVPVTPASGGGLEVLP